MTSDENKLLLLLARMMLQTRTHAIPLFDPVLDRELQFQIEKVEAAEDRAADEERVSSRG